jgi:hypothetical protein
VVCGIFFFLKKCKEKKQILMYFILFFFQTLVFSFSLYHRMKNVVTSKFIKTASSKKEIENETVEKSKKDIFGGIFF